MSVHVDLDPNELSHAETVDLRYKVLVDAREYLMEDWRQKVSVETSTAAFENRPVKRISPPTLYRIFGTADKMFKFLLSSANEPDPEEALEADEIVVAEEV